MTDRHGTREGLKGAIPELRRKTGEPKKGATEHECSKQLSRRSKSKYRTLVEDIPDTILALSVDGKIEYCSPAIRDLGGYEPSEETGSHVSKYFAEKREYKNAAVQFRKAITERTDVVFEFLFKPKTKQPFYVEAAVRPICSGNDVTAVHCVVRDISRFRLLEEPLKMAEARSHHVAESSQEWLWEVDANGLYTYASPFVERILGYEPQEIVGKKHFYDLFHPEDRAYLKRTALQSFDKKQSLEHFTARYTHKTGKTVWLTTKGVPFLGGAGKLMGYQGSSIDVTAYKENEERIKHQRTYLEALVEHAPLAVVVINLEGNITTCNPAFTRLFQYTQAEAIGKPLDALVAYRGNSGEAQSLTQRVMSGGRVHMVTVRYKKDGTPVDIEIFGAPVMVRGQRIGAFAMYQDITERKRSEEHIIASLKEKEVLLKEIHHRVKNNMQVISSLLSLQSASVDDKNVLAILNDSQNRVKSMALIHEKLYQSKNLAKVDFAEYTRNLTDHLIESYRIESSRIDLKSTVQNVALGIDAGISCGLIINELVSNALKHAFPDGRKGEICVDMYRVNGKYMLRVSDNGIGFPKDVDFRDTESLGLQLVNTLTDQLEGSIELNSNGKGTEFKIGFKETE